MKHYKIIGPKFTEEFDIADDRLLEYHSVAESDLAIMRAAGGNLDHPIECEAPKNVKRYHTKKEDL